MRDASLVPGVHRVIRRLDAEEGPFAGALVMNGDSAAVLMDAGELAGWAGWMHAGDEHVAAPLDLVRRADGHDVLLPWCTERVGALLGRRVLAEEPLTAGEVTTLVASLLRGVGELVRADDVDCSGEWWLSADGRPLFAIGTGTGACAATAVIVERLHQECTDRALTRLLGDIAEGLRATGDTAQISTRRLERWETELLETAAPRALRREVRAPVRARDLGTVRRVVPTPRTRRDGRVDDTARLPLLSAARGAVVVGADGVAAVWRRFKVRRGETRSTRAREDRAVVHRETGVPGRPDAPAKRRHLRAVGVAVVAASVVLVAGLLWPGGSTQGEEAASGRAADAPVGAGEAAPDRSMGPPDTTAPVAPSSNATIDDPVAAAPAAVAVISDCLAAGDEVCAEGVAEGSAAAIATVGEAMGDGSTGGVAYALVDQYGDVAVVRMSSSPDGSDKDAAPAGEWMLVLVRVDDKWLVRDAYDVADQPG